MKRIIPGVFAIGLLFAACGDDDTSDTLDTIDTIPVDTVGTIEQPADIEYYTVPTPDELFELIRSTNMAPDATVLNSPDNLQNYNNTKGKALNFGIYSADLAYVSSYYMGDETLQYYTVVNRLGDQLDISSVFDPATMQSIQQKIDSGDGDSLLSFSKDAYFQAYDYLEQNERGPTLAMVVAGGWIESMYIVTQQTPTYDKDSKAMELLAGQKFALENLAEFLNKYGDDADVASILVDMESISSIYASLEEIEVELPANAGGRKVLGGGGTTTRLVISEEQYKELSAAVEVIRNSYTGTTNS